MRKFFTGLIVIFLAVFTACKKATFIQSPDALIGFSSDTLHFDTVFTTTGSVTQSFKIFNQNNQKLRLSNIKLMGESASAFKINVDGTPGVSFSNIELEPNDSIYVFVSVTINPNAENLPFIVRDSILVNYNGNDRFMQLEAFGQNANFYRNQRITQDSTWNNNLPYVILGGLTVDSNVTLTIQKGCKIYCHADAPIIVNGSLHTNGEANDSSRIIFRGDRLDPYYRDYPGSWPGIYFGRSSRNNILNYTVIKNAYQGVITELFQDASIKINLNNCIIDNIYDAGIISLASTVRATNCLISNCGSNIAIAAGGAYFFDNCTVASYGNLYIEHKNPVLFVTNEDGDKNIYPLIAQFRNCIFYGEGGVSENEVVITKKGTPAPQDFNVSFQNVLYKNKDDQPAADFQNSIKNQPPQFDSIDAFKRYFNFHLKPTSPAVNAGINIGVTSDLDGKPRNSGLPDLGCYEQ